MAREYRMGSGRYPKAVRDDHSVIAEALMTFARPTRWETVRVVLRDARIKNAIDPNPDGSAEIAVVWQTPSRQTWRLEMKHRTPHDFLKILLTAVLLSLWVRGAEGMAAEWYPDAEEQKTA